MTRAQDFAARAQTGFNARDIDSLRGLWTDDFHFVGPDGETRGAEAMAAREHVLWTAFPDVRAQVRGVCEGPDVVVLETTMTGTHTGPLQLGDRTIAPSGRPIRVMFSVHLFLRGDRACGERVFYDRLGLLTQLGALPEATAA